MSYSFRLAHAPNADEGKCYPKNLAETTIRIQFERQQIEQQTEFKNVFCISRKQIAAFDIGYARTPPTAAAAAVASRSIPICARSVQCLLVCTARRTKHNNNKEHYTSLDMRSRSRQKEREREREASRGRRVGRFVSS